MCSTASAEAIYKDRGRILHGDDLKGQISGFVDEVLTTIMTPVSLKVTPRLGLRRTLGCTQAGAISITVDDLAEGRWRPHQDYSRPDREGSFGGRTPHLR